MVNDVALMQKHHLSQRSTIFMKTSFSLCYTIPCCVTEQVMISGDANFKQMIEEAMNKAVAKVKLFIMVNKVSPSHFLILLV
jgi:hypothetical protein